MLRWLTKIDHTLAKAEEIFLALLLVGMVVVAALQVLLRNIWATAIDWADVSLQNVTVLIGLLGAAIATSEGRHLNIDLVGRLVTGRSRFLLRSLIGVFAVVICSWLTIGGWETFRANYGPWIANLPPGWTAGRLLRQELAEGSFPQWFSQLFLPFGFGLIGLHFFLRLLRDGASLLTGRDWEEEQGGAEELEGDAFLDRLEAHADSDTAEDRRADAAGAPPAKGDSGGGG